MADPNYNVFGTETTPLALAWRSLPQNVRETYASVPNADPARFLDWDKPLSGQPGVVQEIAKKSFPQDAIKRDILGGSMYRGVSRGMDPLASEYMAERGIPGIKYLDGGSRTAGQGSSNYVIFPGQEHLIDIVRKYGLVPVTAAGAVIGGNALAPAAQEGGY